MQERHNENDRENIKDDKAFTETYQRLSSPIHQVFSHFSEHRKVEGYIENANVPDFIGCDRLLKMDNLFGTVQMGYDPKKDRSFIYANIKTSIFDTAASRYKHTMQEDTMRRNPKSGTQNVLHSSKRREDAAVIIHKAENKPWTENSIAPYLRKVNQGALRKTMPFLLRDEDMEQREKLKAEKKELDRVQQDAINSGTFDVLEEIRKSHMEIIYEANTIQSLLLKKMQLSRWFFRRLNYSIDIQKQEMFAYYASLKRQRNASTAEVIDDAPPKPQGKPDNEENEYE